MFSNIDEKIGELNKKVDRNSKFVIGAMAVITTIVTLLQVVPPVLKVLTQNSNAAMLPSVERAAWITSKTNTFAS